MKVCPAPFAYGTRVARTCGKRVVGDVRPGVGRCAFHVSDEGQAAELALRRAVAELRDLRALPPERGGKKYHREPEREVDADGTVWTWEDDGAAAE